MSDPTTYIADCGHEYTPPDNGTGATGYAVDAATGKTSCYACAYARELVVFNDDKCHRFCAYVSHDGHSIITWTGGFLAAIIYDVTAEGPKWPVRTLRARDAKGRRWHGTQQGECIGNGLFVNLRRMKKG